MLCVRPVIPQDRLSAYGVEKRARTYPDCDRRTCARVCAFRGRWKGTGWLEGLYRFVDETTVIRHCVWPHPRLCQDLWALRSSRRRLRELSFATPPPPPPPHRLSVALLPIPIGSLACNYRISRCCNVGATHHGSRLTDWISDLSTNSARMQFMTETRITEYWPRIMRY